MGNYEELSKMTKKELIAVIKSCDRTIMYWQKQAFKTKEVK